MRYKRARLVSLVPVLVLVLASGLTTAPARAAGGVTVEFSVSGRLNTFPTDAGHTTFAGQATGGGVLTGFSSGGRVTTAEFTHLAMPVSGWVEYGETPQLCPLVGSAANNATHGHIRVGASDLPGTEGITYTAGNTNTGIVKGIVYEFDLTYTRVGPAATVVLGVPGSARATVYFTTPGLGADQFQVPMVGAGEALFYTDYVQAAMNCKNGSGPYLDYVLTGVVHGSST
ncbi:MAG: hypothetical protein M3394_04600 [Actinomycetota bacterium]|nr:hypothetical protein [Actinomycetota bacterium]